MKALCIQALKDIFNKQIDILCGKKPNFDFEIAVKNVRSECRFFGAPRSHRAVVKEQKWPYFEAYRSPQLKPEE